MKCVTIIEVLPWFGKIINIVDNLGNMLNSFSIFWIKMQYKSKSGWKWPNWNTYPLRLVYSNIPFREVFLGRKRANNMQGPPPPWFRQCPKENKNFAEVFPLNVYNDNLYFTYILSVTVALLTSWVPVLSPHARCCTGSEKERSCLCMASRVWKFTSPLNKWCAMILMLTVWMRVTI